VCAKRKKVQYNQWRTNKTYTQIKDKNQNKQCMKQNVNGNNLRYDNVI